MRCLTLVLFIIMQVGLSVMNGQDLSREGGTVQTIYRLSRSEVTLHEPVFMTLTILNGGRLPIKVDLGQDRKQALAFSIIQPDGRIVSAQLPLHEGISRIGTLSIAPASKFEQVVIVNQWYVFPMTGQYQVKVRLVAIDGQQQVVPNLTNWSTLPLKVTPLNTERLEQLCTELKSKIDGSASYADKEEATLALSYVTSPIAIPYLQELALSQENPLAPIAIEGLARMEEEAGLRALIAVSDQNNSTTSLLARNYLSRRFSETTDPDLKQQIQRALSKQ